MPTLQPRDSFWSNDAMGANDALQSSAGVDSRSSLACETCRRRKARCDRTLPHCAVCSRTMQTCTYPAGRLKPGPRIGSTRHNRKSAARRPRQSPECISPESRDTRAESQRTVEQRTVESPDVAQMQCSSSATQSGSSLNGISISTIIHPSHETAATSSEDENLENTSGFFVSLAGPPDMIMGACRDLHVSLAALRKLIDAFHSNMTAFSLFHLPTFGLKTQNVTSPSILKAGFAAMLAFGARFETPPPERVDEGSLGGILVGIPSHETFHTLSLQFLDAAIAECGDEPPSLCLLQVAILTTFYQLIQGVRGRAWRSLGLCIRMAYELGLHQVDSGEPYRQAPESADSVTRWCFDEERRRAWWAIWEMDSFASTIRRFPTAIDWTESETCLPVANQFWFNSQFHRSCYLERKPVERLRALTRCGNESPTAWLIVVLSLVTEAHFLSKPKAPMTLHGPRASLTTQSSRPQSTDVAERLAVVSNALHCFSLALPEALRYHNEYLDFETAEARKLHSAKFSIHVMRQLATLMTYRSSTSNDNDPDHQGRRRFIEASDNVFAIVKNSAEDHVRHVNPFLASTVWFAAAVQLAHRFGAAPGSNTDLIESKFELLRMNCQQYAKFWATPDALLENLSALEAHLAGQRGAARPSPGNETWGNEGQLGAAPLRSYSCSAVPVSGNQYSAGEGDQNELASFTADDDALTGLNLDLDFGLEPSGMSFGLDGVHFDGHAT